MAPLNKDQAPSSQHLHHPMHPKHPLLQIYSSKEFECDGCNALGSGTRYRCDPCGFDLHTLCATCPSTLSSHLHPNHSLTLVNISNSKHRCDLCRDEVDGLFYTCRACDFDVHPLCTELPAQVQHVTHPHHVLKLEEHAIPSWCLVCRHACRSWRYRCGTCGVDIHLECLLISPETTTKSIVVPPSPPPWGRPPASPYPYGYNNGYGYGYSYGYPMSVPYGYNYNPNTVVVPSSGGKRKLIYKVIGMVALRVAVGAIGIPPIF